jgi:DNA replication protein DnaC
MSNDKATALKQTAIPANSEVCPICFGTGMEVVPGAGARRCACTKKDGHSVLILRARIPHRYDNCHLTNFIGGSPSQKIALKFAERFVREYHVADYGLLLMGPCGVGKTHLAVAILKSIVEHEPSCLFYEFGSLLKTIQDSYNPISKTSELAVLAPVFDARVLVLDELGGSKPTDWVKDTMSQIINTRYNDRKLTIFTTNYPDVRKSDKDETLEDRIGVRLRSRLFEMCKTIEIEGEDYRRNFDQGRARK